MSLLRIIVLLQFGLKADEMAECDIIAEAMKLAVNDIKAATLLLKEGNVSKSRQREVIASWAKTSEKPKTGPKNKPKSTRQENITRVMKDRDFRTQQPWITSIAGESRRKSFRRKWRLKILCTRH